MLWLVAVERCCVVWCAMPELAWRAVPVLARYECVWVYVGMCGCVACVL